MRRACRRVSNAHVRKQAPPAGHSRAGDDDNDVDDGGLTGRKVRLLPTHNNNIQEGDVTC